MTNPQWTRGKRRYDKASGLLDRAAQHLEATADFDGPWVAEQALTEALALIDVASRKLNAEHDAARKALGVGIYQPYGRSFRRRY